MNPNSLDPARATAIDESASGPPRLELLLDLLDDPSPVVFSAVRAALPLGRRDVRHALEREARGSGEVTESGAGRGDRTHARVRARMLLLEAARTDQTRRILRFVHSPEPSFESGLWLVSRFQSPGLDLLPYRRAIDALGRELAKRLEGVTSPVRRCVAVREYLGKELRYGGSIGEYDHPDNACLHRVLERKGGLPLTLSAMYAGVARRAGLDASVLPFPGHAMLRIGTGKKYVVLDPYRYGRVRTQRELLRIVAQSGLSFRSAWARPADGLTLFTRQLANLEHSVRRRGLKHQTRCLRTILTAIQTIRRGA